MKSRNQLQAHVPVVAAQCEEEIIKRLRNDDAYVAFDAAKMNKVRHINYSICGASERNRGQPFLSCTFLKGCRRALRAREGPVYIQRALRARGGPMYA